MKQRQKPGPPTPDGGSGSGSLSRKLKPPPVVETEKLDDMLKSEERRRNRKKFGKPSCCGILPCKGRTVWCYECDLCMDCITGAGCGHASSSHAFTQVDVGEDDL